MRENVNTVIVGTGSYLPNRIVPNGHFVNNQFYDKSGNPITKSGEDIVKKVAEISGILERRYVDENNNAVTISAKAGLRAIESAGISKEEIDYLIVAHNFGKISEKDRRSHLVPNLAAMVKKEMGILNHQCAASDILFGCPGWVEGIIQAHRTIQCGEIKHALVIGVEVISRILDDHDMDSMLFGDGAGATVLKAEQATEQRGILTHKTFSHCVEGVDYIKMGTSIFDDKDAVLHPKMIGRQVYRYAVTEVPRLIRECLMGIGLPLQDVSKILMHQANEKMIHAIAEKLYDEYGLTEIPKNALPLTVQNLGNTSVATIPTMLDFILKGEMPDHSVSIGDYWIFAAVGAGMHANCIVYQH